MNSLRLSLMAATCLLSLSSIAGPEEFSAHKAEALATMDKRIANLNEAKTCMTAAADKEAMKNCHMALKEDRMEMHGEMMNKKKNRMEERMKKMEEKKVEMDKKTGP